jgi:uncharacterized damage-inducible protein DinB
MEHLKYPIGHYHAPEIVTKEQREAWISDVENLPKQLRKAVENLTNAQLDTPYREGGWTVRQVVHHVADSHINCYMRYKLAATEDNPTIKPYEEQLWAELPDAKFEPVEDSLAIIDAIHYRWVKHLKNMSETDWARTFYHPGMQKTLPLDRVLGLYSWHGRHHLAHITNAPI